MSWTVPRIWEGGECYIIGGGLSLAHQFDIPQPIINQAQNTPSLYSEYLKPLHDKHVIGINAAYLLGDWIDMVVFGDNGFYLKHRAKLGQFKNIKVSLSPVSDDKVLQQENVKRLIREKRKFGISTNPGMVIWNGNTGAAAISIAYHLGVKRIILLGFDMKLVDNRQHWHSEYSSAKQKIDAKRLMRLPFDKHMMCFPYIASDAKRLGIEIINASPNSAIKEFKKVSIKEIL